MQIIRKKQHVWKAYKRTAKVEGYTKYKDYLKETTNEIKKYKLNFERKLVAIIKQGSKSFLRTQQVKDNDGIVITKDTEMADALNIYFSSVFTLEDNNYLPVYQPLVAAVVSWLHTGTPIRRFGVSNPSLDKLLIFMV